MKARGLVKQSLHRRAQLGSVLVVAKAARWGKDGLAPGALIVAMDLIAVTPRGTSP